MGTDIFKLYCASTAPMGEVGVYILGFWGFGVGLRAIGLEFVFGGLWVSANPAKKRTKVREFLTVFHISS
ncbi:hypothetical protein ACVGV8_00005, partial [Enterobacter intestinihominis]